jgi:hypothetical protein
MPNFDMTKHDASKVGQFRIIKPGKYLVRVFECSNTYPDGGPRQSKEGAEMWQLDMVIEQEGSEFYGQHFRDNIVWSQKAGDRAKLIFTAFGIDATANREYRTDELKEQYAVVTIEGSRTFKDKEGKTTEYPTVAYSGYESASGPIKPITKDEEIPY